MMIQPFLYLAYLVSMIQLGSGNWISDQCANTIEENYRPDWRNGVKRGFKRAHFDNAYYTIPNKPGTTEPEMSLNHVLSWNAIKQIMSSKLEDIYDAANAADRARHTTELANFIARLFTIDPAGYVHTDSTNNAFVRPRGSETHRAYLGANGADLVTKNGEIGRSAVAILAAMKPMTYPVGSTNCKRIKQMLNDVFHAPANLRYGLNDNLDDLLDPMGNRHGELTGKESHWISLRGYNWEKSTINNNWYLESSTGLKLRERGGYVPSHWIECSSTDRNCQRIPNVG